MARSLAGKAECKLRNLPWGDFAEMQVGFWTGSCLWGEFQLKPGGTAALSPRPTQVHPPPHLGSFLERVLALAGRWASPGPTCTLPSCSGGQLTVTQSLSLRRSVHDAC